MPLQGLAQELLGGRQVTPFAEPELNRIAIAVDRAVEIPPMPADLDVDTV